MEAPKPTNTSPGTPAPAETLNAVVDVISTAVNLRNVNRAEISRETSLMQGGLGLDSVDILEAVIALEKRFDVKIDSSPGARHIFKDLGSLSDYIAQNKRS